jgi:hypothetical protein
MRICGLCLVDEGERFGIALVLGAGRGRRL